tara:strand:+ start:510 stop:935 length:426 start_codon:yes stop_codon:yes gene_type:complete
MKKYFALLTFIFFWSCENNTPTEPNDNEDSPLVLDTVRFSNLTNLFKNQCYQCHSEEGFSFYGLNLDTYGNVMSGSINGPVVIPFEPYQSLLYIKCTPEFLQNSDLSTGGERMPKENESFFDDNPEKLQLIHDWIKDGCIE